MKQVNQTLLRKLVSKRNVANVNSNFRLVVLTNEMTQQEKDELLNTDCPGVTTFIVDFTGETVPYDRNKISQPSRIENESMSIVYK